MTLDDELADERGVRVVRGVESLIEETGTHGGVVDISKLCFCRCV